MTADDTSRRISFLTLGVTFTALCGFAAWVTYALLIMYMNPQRPDYWQEVRNRAAANPMSAGIIVCAGIGFVGGLALIVKSVVPRVRRPGGPP